MIEQGGALSVGGGFADFVPPFPAEQHDHLHALVVREQHGQPEHGLWLGAKELVQGSQIKALVLRPKLHLKVVCAGRPLKMDVEMDVVEEMQCVQRSKDWIKLLWAIRQENTRPSCEGWIKDEYLWDPIPHDAIDMILDLTPWTWMEPNMIPDLGCSEQPIVIFDEPEPKPEPKEPEPKPEPVPKEPEPKLKPKPVPGPVFRKPNPGKPVWQSVPRRIEPATRRADPVTEANEAYLEWARETSMEHDMFECLCKWCTS